MKKTPLLMMTLVALGCGKEPAPVVSTSPQPGAVERALCLADVKGTTRADEEVREASRALQLTPAKKDLAIVLGRAWVKKARNSGDPGFYLHADACAKLVLLTGGDGEPEHVPALELHALALLNDHEFAEARDLARRMLDKDRDDLVAWAALSDALLELGDAEGAARAAQEMMDRKPSLPSYARASYLMWLRGDVDGALVSIKYAYDAGRGQKDHEPAAWVLTEAANIFWHKGDVEGALAGYEMALAEKEDHAPALVGKARALVARGNARGAVPLLERALILAPLVDTAGWLARAHELAGDEAAAGRALAQAVRIGRTGDARSLAVLLATRNQDLAEAKRMIALDAAERGGVYGADAKALVLWRMGDLEGAKAASAEAVSLGTPDPRLKLHRGLILVAAGDESGRAMIDDAMKMGLENDPWMKALAADASAAEVTQ